MPATIATKAVEKSTFVITASFKDEKDNAVTPDTLTWSLVDRNGRVVNSRNNVTPGSLSASVDIVLSGDDLAIAGEGEAERWVLFKGTYTSDAGSGLPIKDQVSFRIVNLKSI